MPIDLSELMPLIVAVLTALIAVYKYWMEHQKVEFYDPVKVEALSPVARAEVACKLPDRSYKMSETTRAYVLLGNTPEDRVSINNQINEAEARAEVRYQIRFSTGHYDIEYGILAGGGGTPL